jgi:ABC-2 type transport system permease protein
MLVKNEIIKLALKSGTQILAVLLIVASAGICTIYFFATNHSWDYWYQGDEIQEYKDEIRWAKEDKFEGWENYVAELEFKIETNMKRDDWRNEFVYMMFHDNWTMGTTPIEALGQEAQELLKKSDWKALYEVIIEAQEKALKAEGADSELIEIHNWKYVYCLENDIAPVPTGDRTWKNNLVDNMPWLKTQLYEMGDSENLHGEEAQEIENLKEEIIIATYRLDNNISRTVKYGDALMGMGYEEETDVWSLLEACVMMIPFMSVFIIIIAGGLVSSEFSKGTIKFLLINPVKRWKILASKYTVMLLTGAAFLALMFAIFFIMGSVLTGFINTNAVNLTVSNGAVVSIPAFIYYGKLYLLGTVTIAVISTLAFALSSVSRNSGLSIAISIAALIGGNIINDILRYIIGVDWGRYLLFANIDLVSIIHGGMLPGYKGQTLTFAIGVIAVHMVIFLLTAWDGFTKKEI